MFVFMMMPEAKPPRSASLPTIQPRSPSPPSVTTAAPHLTPRTYYGMPAWAKDGKVLCFFQPKAKFKARYATFGFNDDAALDEGPMWATSWALIELTTEVEREIARLVKRAAG